MANTLTLTDASCAGFGPTDSIVAWFLGILLTGDFLVDPALVARVQAEFDTLNAGYATEVTGVQELEAQVEGLGGTPVF